MGGTIEYAVHGLKGEIGVLFLTAGLSLILINNIGNVLKFRRPSYAENIQDIRSKSAKNILVVTSST